MSHISTGKVAIEDLECLKSVVDQFEELEWRDGQQTFKWYGNALMDSREAIEADKIIPRSEWGKCSHAIAMKGKPGAYEIGVVRNPVGKGWLLLFDSFAQGENINRILGNGLQKLHQGYQEAVFDKKTRHLVMMGYKKTRTVAADGGIRIQLTRG